MNANPQEAPVVQPAAGESMPPLPRINIHVFCATPETAKTVQTLSADRRMKRTSMEVYSGGIAAAAQYYAQVPTPHLLVVESTNPPEVMLNELAALAQVCAAETQVVVIGQVNDIAFYRQLMSMGLGDYLATPVNMEQLLSSFSRLFQPQAEKKLGRIVAFMGAKGGCGSSIIAHNVSWLMSEKHSTGTVLADLDLAFGTAGLDFNVDPVQGILDALASKERLDEVFMDRLLHQCSKHLMLLASPGSVDSVIDIQGETLDLMLDILRGTTPYTVLDMPTTWDGWLQAALVQADVLVLVSTPELAALRNTKSIVDTLKSIRPNDEPPLLVLNQVGMGDRPEIPASKFTSAVGLEVAASIPFDAQTFGQAATSGQMITEIAPKAEAAKQIDALARRILGLEPEEEAKSAGSLLKPLLAAFQKKQKQQKK